MRCDLKSEHIFTLFSEKNFKNELEPSIASFSRENIFFAINSLVAMVAS